MKESDKQKEFIRKYKRNKIKVVFIQVFILIGILLLWEVLAYKEVINSFITSCPSKIVNNIISLFVNDNLLYHIWVTASETLIAFFITLVVSLIFSLLIYRFKTFDKVIDPYLTILNSLPKVALGPVIIIWVGANKKSIILMAILISVIASIQSISHGFKGTNKNRVKLLKSFKASEIDILFNLVIPNNYGIIINQCKINIGLCLIGVIMGEFLTSKAGIGYLILYGSQVFNLALVMSGIVVLLFLSILLYKIICVIEKHLECD